MTDTELEERLRTVLREEGDRLPFTVDIARVEAGRAARSASSRNLRFGLLAAGIGIVAFGMAGIGLIRQPSAAGPGATPHATSAVPSPVVSQAPDRSGTASGGLEPIRPRDGSTVVFEISPTPAVPGTSHSFTSAGSQTAVTWITIACLGPGTDDLPPEILKITITGTESEDVACIADQPYMVNLPLGQEQRVSINVPSDEIVYTILAESVPVPTELPALEPLDEEPEIEASSEHPRADWGASSGVLEATVGTLDEGLAQELSYVCLGPGTMSIELHAPGSSQGQAPLAATGIDCIGEPDRVHYAVGLEGPIEVRTRVDNRSAWHVLGASVGERPAFTPPTLRMTSWIDGGEQDGQGQAALVGCGFDWNVDGEGADVDCAGPEWPDMAGQTPVLATRGGELRIQIEQPWAFSSDVSIVSEAEVGQAAPPATIRAVDTGEGEFDGLLVPVTFGPGRWVMRADVHGIDRSDEFDASYFFLVDVAA
jgi:hypothetical protein